jgi:hypothetical protein
MKIKILLLLLVSVVGFSQKKKINEEYDYINNYYQFVYQANFEYLSGNYQKAYDLLKTAEKNCPLLNQTGIYEPRILAECAVVLGKNKEAVGYLEILVRDYGYKMDSFKDDSLYIPVQNTRKWKKLEKKSEKYYQKYLSNVNLELRNEIFKMKVEDQSVRTGGFDADKAKVVDSINELKLRKIVADCDCYPDTMFNEFGNYWVDKKYFDAFVFVMHINREKAEYWKPIFLDLIKRGRAPANIYGSLIDSNLRINGMFDYGIYQNVKAENINDFENLDKRRVSVGLPPWELKKEIDELIEKKYDY